MPSCLVAKRGRTPGDGDEAVDNPKVKETETLRSHQKQIRLCLGDDLNIECETGEVFVASGATFGRMEFNECLMANDFIGCENDVLFLVDRWCSGRRRCNAKFPNRDIELANKACLPYLKMYLQVSYSCLKGNFENHYSVFINPLPDCQVPNEAEGVLSSHITGGSGCGSPMSPWVVSAQKGKTISIDIVDFGSESFKTENKTDTFPLYGYIRDELGCPDLSPPKHAWYKRDGDQAVIGCEWSQKTWHLSCDGRSWSGVVGNCSGPVTQETVKTKKESSNPSVLWIVCLVSVSVVLVVAVCVIGIVFVKKYRIKQDVHKSITLQRLPGQGHYDLDPNIEMASMLYLPYMSSEQQQQGTLSDPHRPTSYLIPQDQVVNELTPIRIWERPLPDVPDKFVASDTTVSTTRTGRTPGDGDESITNSKCLESGTHDDGRSATINKTFPSCHKYSDNSSDVC
ncbi:hypothetical protein LSH36_776g02156 [Paralvinella palmiformis]|uniref:SUEL-type lectin domain-containing protein n=1 Tax=Paralvinella palmiformis TaxID=53620 RepID=A0AAD9MSW5_9ANNE|nr:hypothetical protein LSH36_776g02156 [Paralvinella palmiformis]